mmetsp:Transcript_48097/g.154148  ORF Transcript_48097/g.154148 Transcript_48097/m.154148 type:complete len:233 (-) Transcript_48097:37-735(-)
MSATRETCVHTAAVTTLHPCRASSAVTSESRPGRSAPDISRTVASSPTGRPVFMLPLSRVWQICRRASSLLGSDSLFPCLSVTWNSSTNHPPSEDILALLTTRSSSVRYWTTSTRVPGLLALSTVSSVACSSQLLSTVTLGGLTRSSSVSYSSRCSFLLVLSVSSWSSSSCLARNELSAPQLPRTLPLPMCCNMVVSELGMRRVVQPPGPEPSRTEGGAAQPGARCSLALDR